jgi:hypothetical protein
VRKEALGILTVIQFRQGQVSAENRKPSAAVGQ